MLYVWVAIGSALGGLARFALGRWMLPVSLQFPWSTVCVNVLGCFVIGFASAWSGRDGVSEEARVFVMVGVCGGFTTFSSFSLQTFELWRRGEAGRGLLNVGLSVGLCLVAVAAGHWIGLVGKKA